jgi:hypothetical protein
MSCPRLDRFHREQVAPETHPGTGQSPQMTVRAAGMAAARAENSATVRQAPNPPPVQPNRKPENELAVTLAILAVSFLYLFLFRRQTSIEPDEGIILQSAQRILHGQIAYRDFFSYFTPGSYCLLALLFKLFGSSFLVARTALAVYGGLMSVFTYLLARRVCSRWSALLAGYLVAFTALPWRFLVLHNWDSTLWACTAIYCAVRWMEVTADRKADRNTYTAVACLSDPGCSSLITRHSSPRCWAFATGSFVSLTTLFEQSKGAGLALGLGMGFVILALAGKNQQAEGRTQKAETRSDEHCPSLITRRSSLSLCAGLAWPLAMTFAYFGAHHALHQMLADWLWPLHHYSRANTVPYGYQNWSDEARRAMFGSGFVGAVLSGVLIVPCFVLPVLPLIPMGLLAYLMPPWGRTKLPFERWRYYVLVSGAISGLLVSVVVARADILHFVYLGPVLYLVIAWLLGSGDFQIELPRPLNQLFGGVLLLCFTLLGLAFLLTARGAHFNLNTRHGLVKTSRSDEVIQYTQTCVPAGSQIFIYPYRPLYYYLTATYNPTRFEYLQPGMHSRQQEEEAIREIEVSRTRVVLFELGFNQKIAASWPNTPIQAIANDPVGDYILTHYRSCKVLKSAAGCRFLFMVRKDANCPR